jgi:hypothetical protein
LQKRLELIERGEASQRVPTGKPRLPGRGGERDNCSPRWATGS